MKYIVHDMNENDILSTQQNSCQNVILESIFGLQLQIWDSEAYLTVVIGTQPLHLHFPTVALILLN